MKFKSISISIFLILFSLSNIKAADNRYVGGDISLLPSMEKAGSNYYDKDGKKITDLIQYSYDQGMNAMRVRLFVDPETFLKSHSGLGSWYNDACQDYDYILPICKRIQEAGHKLLLDFHYSDTWADPSNQWTPAAWESLNDNDLYQKIYEYTKDVLTNLKNDGVIPEFIQTGNEISYGMCWGGFGTNNARKAYTNSNNSNLTRFGNLLTNAIKACREVCPQSKIVLHTERVANTTYLTGYYDWAKSIGLDYDIIGLSYYFYYHGRVSQLESALNALDNKKYGKEIWIVETGCYLNWAMGDSDKQYYGTTEADQNQFVVDLLETLDKHSSVTGLFWWEMEYNAKGTSLSNWYNASLFDNNTGKATSAFYTFSEWASGEPNKDPDNNDNEDSLTNLYFLYNNSGSSNWAVPGTLMNNNQEGVYSISSVNISQSGSDYGWFSITSDPGTDWTSINSNRYGPETNNEDPSLIVSSKVSKVDNSWQVPNGIYDVIFDSNTMTLTVKVTGTENLVFEIPNDIEGISGYVEDDQINISAPKTEDSDITYIYVVSPKNATGLYYKVAVNQNVSTLAIEGYNKAEIKEEKFRIPLVIGSKGTLNLYYTTEQLRSVPVSYSYMVQEIVIDDPKEDDPSIDDPKEDDPSIDDPKEDDPSIDDPKEDDPSIDDPKEDDPSIDDPKEDDPSIDDPKEDDPSIDDPKEDDPSIDDPKEDDPSIDDPKEDDPSIDDPKEDDPSIDDPKEDDPSIDDPKEDNPSIDDPKEDDPSIDDPKEDNPSIDDPKEDDPSIDDPGEDDPSIDDPKEDDPSIDDPKEDDPSIDDPGEDDPSIDEPGEDDPSIDDSGEDAGINDIYNSNSANDYWFDLRGIRINPPSAPGLYIHNGKKVLIKRYI